MRMLTYGPSVICTKGDRPTVKITKLARRGQGSALILDQGTHYTGYLHGRILVKQDDGYYRVSIGR